MARIPRLTPITDPAQITPARRVPELIRVPADKTLSGIIVSLGVFKLPTHWNGTRTVLCTDSDDCPLCPHRAKKLYYLVAVHDRNQGSIVWVELTEQAGKSLLAQAKEFQVPLYGALVRITRERKTMKSPVRCAIDLSSTVHGRLPKAVEPYETLERVFNSPKSNGSTNA